MRLIARDVREQGVFALQAVKITLMGHIDGRNIRIARNVMDMGGL